MEAALKSGDIDILRIHLQQQLAAASAAPAPSEDATAEEANPAVDALVDKAVIIADDLLRRGLPHLEREAKAEAEAAASGAERSAATSGELLRLPDLDLTLRAEPIMGGAVVWPAAYALCRWLKARAETCCAGVRCIELGAGGGAPGLVALGAGAAHVLLTDGDASLLPLLEANCASNAPTAAAPPPPPWAVAALDWREPDAIMEHAAGSRGFDLVLAADVLYSVGDIVPLIRAACALLRCHEGPATSVEPRPPRRFLVARSAWFEDLQPTLIASAQEQGFTLASEESSLPRDEDGAAATVLEFMYTPGAHSG